ncbi:hypothetical protein LCGC14_0898420 [marine sediment metagenome]|uniref:Bacteriophage Mu GpT domain-containing protein n=1 Tax=marine sediment metagenome TaxID=412755 RepID=A0A0F9NX46_9ZZZZ
MATTILGNITARGTMATFLDAMGVAPNVWRKHVDEVKSDAPDERHVWLGQLPIPREFVSMRNIQGFRDFTYTLKNNEYEMSFIIDQNTFEDDRHGLVGKRIKEVAEGYATFKDDQFASLLIAGETSTATFDGITYYSPARTIGLSGTINNSLTVDATDHDDLTVAEVLAALRRAMLKMWRYGDDQGRLAYNASAMSDVRVVIAPEHEKAFTEAINSTLISSSDNPWGNGLVSFDVLPFLTDADDAVYISALGSQRKPFVYQERTALQVQVFNSPNEIADAHGLKVLTRQRYRFGYGEPRRNVRHDFT